MESPKYLIIVTLIDGHNFALPDGVPDKVEATVFAEARFGNESILKSDPIKLTNSNPEFVTELAWQLDKRSLHQIRVERRAIKLQVFIQTRNKKKSTQQNHNIAESNGFQGPDSSSTHKVELIGYTILDIRSAQEREPKFQWLPLLNPKFRKSSYNRPEIQLAITLSRVDQDSSTDATKPSTSGEKDHGRRCEDETKDYSNSPSKFNESGSDSANDSRLYKTCLDISTDSEAMNRDEIIENDIKIRSIDGCFYVYDARDPTKSTIDDCDEKYRITITIPFNSELETLVDKPDVASYYFSVLLFGTSLKSELFNELTSVVTKEMQYNILTTHSAILTTYFELNSSLIIKLHNNSGEPLGIATIQLDQLASLDSRRRSIEGIFALQSMSNHHDDIPSAIHPTIGVSIVLEKLADDLPLKIKHDSRKISVENEDRAVYERSCGDIDDYLFKSYNDTHQLTFDSNVDNKSNHSELSSPGTLTEEDHHFCFTIDLKNFFYTQSQRLIPTLRELVVRYTYPFFGYKDTITTDASMPISPTKSIIVSGFCEFNFATTTDALLTALTDIPLDLHVLVCDQGRRIGDETDQFEQIVATCKLNLAETLELNKFNIVNLQKESLSATVTPPIFGVDGQEVGQLQVYLSLKDLGRPTFNFKASVENLEIINDQGSTSVTLTEPSKPDKNEIDSSLAEFKKNLESMKEEYLEQITQEMRKREVERFRRLCQRFEAKDARREQEFREKIDELANLEKRFKNSLAHLETLERKFSINVEQLKSKDTILDNRLDTFDMKISKAIADMKSEYLKKLEFGNRNHRGSEDLVDDHACQHMPIKSSTDLNQPRRSSLKSTNAPGIPLPIRSSSLVRGSIDGTSRRLVKRPTGVVTTVVNGISSRPRSNSTRLNLSKETQEKLASLRREKAELLKRGCRPNDELIQEINSLIEKLAC